jgi:hypothetical protein
LDELFSVIDLAIAGLCGFLVVDFATNGQPVLAIAESLLIPCQQVRRVYMRDAYDIREDRPGSAGSVHATSWPVPGVSHGCPSPGSRPPPNGGC